MDQSKLEEIMEFLKASQYEMEAERKADKEELMAKMDANERKMDSNQGKTDANLKAMKADQSESDESLIESLAWRDEGLSRSNRSL
jgi:hypothetical protein